MRAWKFERAEMPLTDRTTSPGTSPDVSAMEPGSTFLMMGWTEEPSTLKKDYDNTNQQEFRRKALGGLGS